MNLKHDSSSNVTDLCPVCTGSVTASDSDSLKCDLCNNVLHPACAGLSHSTACTLRTIIQETGWVCLPCRTITSTKISLLQSTQAKLVEELAVLKDEISEIRSQTKKETVLSDQNVVQSSDIAATVTLEVHRELSNMIQRRSNVIISGLPESQEYQGRVMTDEEAFCKLCEEHLTVKPSIARQGCRRLGKLRGNSSKSRRLLVPLTTEENAKSLLSVARNLRHSDISDVATNVYINPDLTPAEAKLAYEKRVRRRQRQAEKQHNNHI